MVFSGNSQHIRAHNDLVCMCAGVGVNASEDSEPISVPFRPVWTCGVLILTPYTHKQTHTHTHANIVCILVVTEMHVAISVSLVLYFLLLMYNMCCCWCCC